MDMNLHYIEQFHGITFKRFKPLLKLVKVYAQETHVGKKRRFIELQDLQMIDQYRLPGI